MARKKSHLTLKLGPQKQRDIFNNVLIKRYLAQTGKDYFTSDAEKDDLLEQLNNIWEKEFKDHTGEFANLSPKELEDLFEQIEVSFDDDGDDGAIGNYTLDGRELDDFEKTEQAATAIIMNIPLREAGFDTNKIRFDRKDPLSMLNEIEQIQVRWAYDVAVRIARYAYEDDKEVRKYLRKEIHGLLSAYLPKQKIIPVRDLMIDEYKDGLLFL